MPFAGETLPLSLQLYDFNATKFARVHLRDQAGTPLAGSPFDLVHIGQGKYTSAAVVMPTGVDYIEATYEVFASAADRTAGTPLDPDYTSATDVYRFEIPDTVIVDLLNDILAKLGGFALPGAAVTVTIDQDELQAVIQDVKQAKAIVERDPAVMAQVRETGSVTAQLGDDEIDAKVDC